MFVIYVVQLALKSDKVLDKIYKNYYCYLCSLHNTTYLWFIQSHGVGEFSLCAREWEIDHQVRGKNEKCARCVPHGWN